MEVRVLIGKSIKGRAELGVGVWIRDELACIAGWDHDHRNAKCTLRLIIED